MAATRKGVWDLQEVRDKQLASEWTDYVGTGNMYVMGRNNKGSLGQNDVVYRSSPVQVPGTTWSSSGITWKSNGIFSLKTDNTLWAWGDNEDGNLGLNAPEASAKSSPTQIPGTRWTKVYASSRSVIAQQTLEE